MSDDPKDILAAAIATLPEEQQASIQAMPEKERRMAHAIALWGCGHSLRFAAGNAGVPTKTLHNTIQRHELARDKTLERLEPLYDQIAQEGARQQIEALYEGEFKPSQLPVVTGIAADKLVKMAELRRTHTDRPNQLADFFEQLAKRGVKRVSLDIETEDPAIDVTPKETP